MSTKNKAVKDYTGTEFVITREFDAPRELVFAAWTDPKHLAQWWGPRGFTNPTCEWDVRPGGKIYDVMRSPNGTDYGMSGEFRDIVPPEKLVFLCGALDDKGEMLFEFLHDATFTEKNGKTKLLLRSKVLRTTADANKDIGGFEAGMTQSLERLAELLAQKEGPLVVERILDAPTALVWRCITTVEDMSRWFFDLKEFKPQAGYEFQFTVEHQGMTFRHLCKVTEVVPQKKIAFTWRYDGHEGDSLVALELFAEGKKTRLKLTHEGLETFPKTPQFARKNFEGGWNFISTALKDFVDNVDREIFIARFRRSPRTRVGSDGESRARGEMVGPRGFTTTNETMDFREGGSWKHIMRGPDGRDYPNESVFQEIVKPERIVYSHGGGEKGKRTVDFVSTWTFEALGANKTRVSIRMVFSTVEARDFVVREHHAIEGGRQTLERMAECLKEMPSF